ncbi:hypothetical protein O71_02302 [Pontibacter sp. BAB1700]|nr:hypothetical protein O71_02302 [Pontibacter sp. BAB1700]
MVISDSSYALVTYLKEADVLSISWKLKPDTDQFRNLYWQVLQFVKTNPKICYYSTDISRIGPFDAEQEIWLSREYYPQVSDIIGVDIYAAVIFSEATLRRLSTTTLPPNCYRCMTLFTLTISLIRLRQWTGYYTYKKVRTLPW